MVIVLKQNPDGSKVEQLMKRLRGMGLISIKARGKARPSWAWWETHPLWISTL